MKSLVTRSIAVSASLLLIGVGAYSLYGSAKTSVTSRSNNVATPLAVTPQVTINGEPVTPVPTSSSIGAPTNRVKTDVSTLNGKTTITTTGPNGTVSHTVDENAVTNLDVNQLGSTTSESFSSVGYSGNSYSSNVISTSTMFNVSSSAQSPTVDH